MKLSGSFQEGEFVLVLHQKQNHCSFMLGNVDKKTECLQNPKNYFKILTILILINDKNNDNLIFSYGINSL